MTYDYTEDQCIADSDDRLGQLSTLAGDLQTAQDEVAKIESDLAIAKSTVVQLSEETIPELMSEIGMTEFRTEGGFAITVERKVFASIPKYRMGEAVDWLDDNDEGGMVKRKVIVAFNRDQEEAATALAKKLGGTYPAGVEQVYSVHSSTLRAWARKRVEAGKETPEELFGIHTKQIAKLG